MINLAYITFLWVLVAEAIIFLLLTLPTPANYKARIIQAFMWSRTRAILLWVHLGMCVLASIFFF
jgi:hypothetical protein